MIVNPEQQSPAIVKVEPLQNALVNRLQLHLVIVSGEQPLVVVSVLVEQHVLVMYQPRANVMLEQLNLLIIRRLVIVIHDMLVVVI